MKFTLSFSCLVALALLVLTGCGSTSSNVSSMPGVHPNYHRPFKSMTTTPLVECVGDDICIGLVAAANGPNSSMWRCDDCSPGATSGQVLANLPLALARKPDIVLIITGSYDVDDPNWSGVCNDDPKPAVETCNNLVAIIDQVQAANIPSIFGDVPFWEGGTLSSRLAPDYDTYGVDLVNGNISFLDHALSGPFIEESVSGPVGFVEFASELNDPDDIGPTGIDPSAQGYQKMLGLVDPMIQSLHVGGTK